MSKKEWGNATWYLFHTLAEKLKPEFTHDAREVYNEIYKICGNLPCQECLDHATKTLKYVNVNNIKTREDLIILIWQFHNKVNAKANKQQFTLEECNELYKKSNMRNVVNNFLYIMKQKSGSERAMLLSHHRNSSLKNFTNYINKNLHKFNI